MKNLLAIVMLFLALPSCAGLGRTLFGSAWDGYLPGESERMAAVRAAQRAQKDREIADAQVRDRSGMNFEQLCAHLSNVRAFSTPKQPLAYIEEVLDDIAAASPWPEDERRWVRARQAGVGMSEAQLRIARGAPTYERQINHRYGRVLILRYGSVRRGTTYHLTDGRITIVDS